jgi:hypothetical protein
MIIPFQMQAASADSERQQSLVYSSKLLQAEDREQFFAIGFVVQWLLAFGAELGLASRSTRRRRAAGRFLAFGRSGGGLLVVIVFLLFGVAAVLFVIALSVLIITAHQKQHTIEPVQGMGSDTKKRRGWGLLTI